MVCPRLAFRAIPAAYSIIFPGTPVTVGIEPTWLGAAQDHIGIFWHLGGDVLEIVRLRLVHIVSELDVSTPQPPAIG